MTEPVFDLRPPTGLRFRRRHVARTLTSFVRQNLVARGWGNRDLDPADPANANLNFGSQLPLKYISELPEFVDPAQITLNMVAITIGDEPETELEQLGGGLYSVSYPLTVDVYGESASTSVSIAGDVKVILANRQIPVFDFSGSTPVQATGEYIDIEAVRGPVRPDRPEGASAEFRRHWRMITADAVGFFTTSELD